VADVQLHQVRDFVDERDVAVVDAMPGVDLQVEIQGALRGLA